MDDEAVPVKVLAFLQEKTGEQNCGSLIADAPGEDLSRCAFPGHAGCYSHTLKTKSFHGVWAEMYMHAR
jgi:hypothetical protein